MIHENAYFERGVETGEVTNVWYLIYIRKNAIIGASAKLLAFINIGKYFMAEAKSFDTIKKTLKNILYLNTQITAEKVK